MGNVNDSAQSPVQTETTQQQQPTAGGIDTNEFERFLASTLLNVNVALNQALNQAINRNGNDQPKTVPKDIMSTFEKFTFNNNNNKNQARRENEMEIEEQPNMENESKNQDADNTCPICLDAFESGNELLRLPCKHTFHEPCATKWLGEHANSCPCCRKVFSDDKGKDSETTGDNQNAGNSQRQGVPLVLPFVTPNGSNGATMHLPVGFQQIVMPDGNIIFSPIFTAVNFTSTPNPTPATSTSTANQTQPTSASQTPSDVESTEQTLRNIISENSNQVGDQIGKACSLLSISSLKRYLDHKHYQYQSRGLEKRDLAEFALNIVRNSSNL